MENNMIFFYPTVIFFFYDVSYVFYATMEKSLSGKPFTTEKNCATDFGIILTTFALISSLHHQISFAV